MGMIRSLGSRKYLQRILIYFNLSAATVLILFSFSYYFSTKNIVLRTQQDANEKVLAQIKYNIHYLNEIVQNIGIMMSLNKSMIYLMNAREPDPFTKFQTLQTLDTVADSTSFVDSIAVYSDASKQLYVSGSGKWSREHPSELREMTLAQLRQFAPSPSGRLVPMKLDPTGPNVDLFSYFVLENHPADGALPNAVVVNIRPQWIFDNISNLNELADARDGVFVFDQDGQMLAYHDGKDGGGTEGAVIDAADLNLPVRPGASGQWSIRDVNGREFFVSEMSIGLNDWKLVSLLSYEKVMGRVESFRNISFLLIAVALIASLVLSIAAGNRLYKPVGKLTELFKRHSGDREREPSTAGDEMSYISGVYRDTLNELESVNRVEKQNERIVNDYRLRRWVTDSGSATEAELRECAEAHPALFAGDRPRWRLAVLVPDSPAGSSSVREDLFRFAVCNITEETLSRAHSASVLDMKNEFIVAILRLPDGKAESPDALKRLLREAIDTCCRYYGRTFSVSVGEPVTDAKAISEAYHSTVQQLMYRLLYGRGSVILPEDVAANMERQDAAIPPEWEKKLGEAIRSKDGKAIRAALDKWFDAIATFPYDDMTFAVQQLVLVVKPIVREPAFQGQIHPVELQTLSAKVIRSDTLAEMREKIERFLELLCEAGQLPQKEDKNKMIVDAIKEFVEKNELDINLSLQNIASSFKMSTAYVGRIFKQYENMSVGDYINGHRLDKAREMLLGSDFSVKEIADYLGFTNSSYFITLFKKRYGITPKEYRFNRTVGGEAKTGSQSGSPN